MDLNTGKPDANQALKTAGITLAALGVTAIALSIAVWALPKEYDPITPTRVIALIISVLIIAVSLTFGWAMMRLTIKLWYSYVNRQDDWHNAEIDMYYQANGLEVTQTISELELAPDIAAHVLITALTIQWRMERAGAQARWKHAPWSVRGLEEKLYLDGNHNTILLGECTGTRPEAMSAKLADLGLVANRKPGYAGDWVPHTMGEVFEQVARNWGKR